MKRSTSLTVVAMLSAAAIAPACESGTDDPIGKSTSALSITPFSDGFEALPVDINWSDGSTHGQWLCNFNGFGKVGVQRESTTNQVLLLDPRSAALVTSVPSFDDLDFSVRVRTVAQTAARKKQKPWEVGWVLWHFTDNTHFYYVLLKPNGWELGKEDPAYRGAQRFLATGDSPTFPIGVWRTVRVVHIGAAFTVYVDGALLTSFEDTERPYSSGKVGLYSEAARVWYDDVNVQAP